jgi:hypothetical protein
VITIVRSGVTRTVLLTRRYAVKVPSLRGVYPGGARGRLAGAARGLLANQSEATWSGYPTLAGRVAPVLWSGLLGLVQVYPRCAPLDAEVEAAFQAGFDALKPRLDPDPGDDKPDNYGLLNGRVVRLDYEM